MPDDAAPMDAQPMGRALGGVSMAALACAVGWAVVGGVDVMAAAPGRSIPVERSRPLQAAEPSVVQPVLVGDGERVAVGQGADPLDAAGPASVVALDDDTAGTVDSTINSGVVRLPAGIEVRKVGHANPDPITVIRRARDALTGSTARRKNGLLVFDLDGNGVELMARYPISPRFDMDGDGFAERTAWVRWDDGLLARDLNANGTIDDVGELFGGAGGGFAALAAHDANSDSTIDAGDAVFTDLRIWQDINRDHITDAGELKTLGDHGITAISLASSVSGALRGGSVVERTGTFTRADASTGEIADVTFDTDQVDTSWLGDTTAELPNVRGRGTLPNLHMAATLSPGLVSLVKTALPAMDTNDLKEMRTAMRPVLAGWVAALPTPAGQPGGVARFDVPVLETTTPTGGTIIEDFGVRMEDEEGFYWRLNSRKAIVGEFDDVIARPTIQDVLDQFDREGSGEVLYGSELTFLQRYLNMELPVGTDLPAGNASQSTVRDLMTGLWHQLNRIAVRLAIQGPLAGVFPALAYDLESDRFRATTDRSLVPVFYTFLYWAPVRADDAATSLAEWSPFVDVLLSDFDRGASHLRVSYAFLFQMMVAAWENADHAIDLSTFADTFGVPADMIRVGAGTIEGTSGEDLFYLNATDQTLRGGVGQDVYVVGAAFGHDVIDEQEPHLIDQALNVLRFAQHNVDDLHFRREGIDLIIERDDEACRVTDSIRVIAFFDGPTPGLSGGLSADNGVSELIFKDGTVRNEIDIARAVSHPLPGDETLIGTPTIDFLDGGPGNDRLEGGGEGDYYWFGRGRGHDVIFDQPGDVLVDGPDEVVFDGDIRIEDLRFSRSGNSNDLVIEIVDTAETLTIEGQFASVYTDGSGPHWMNRIETFQTSDALRWHWHEVAAEVLLRGKTDGDDELWGFDLGDTLDGGPGNDVLRGGNGSETYVYGLGYGHDTIDETRGDIQSDEADRVLFGYGILPDLVTLSRAGDSNDLVFKFVDGGTLTVRNQFLATNSGASGTLYLDRIEAFQFADGTVWTHDDVMGRLRTGPASDDTLHGLPQPDTPDGGAGMRQE